jgi:hypothetical protein
MYSPDGRWWWNGSAWIPTPQWKTRYEQTPWTRKLQIAVLALQAVSLLLGIFTIPLVFGSVLSNQAALGGDPQTTDAIRQVFTGVLVFAGILSLAVLAVLVVGVLKLWRWLYWYLMISYGFALLAIPLNLTYAFGNGPISYPWWYFAIVFPTAIAEAALFVWMVVAYRRYGNWARRKIVEPA